MKITRAFALPLAVGLALTFCVLGAMPGAAQTNIESVLHGFTNSPDGAFPLGNLALANNALYGVTISGGTVNSTGGTLFTINLDGSGYQVVHSFSASESGGGVFSSPPNPVLTVTAASDGTLYGTTHAGGPNGDGSIYKINPDGSSYSVIHSFGAVDVSPTFLIQGRDGELYGTCEEAASSWTCPAVIIRCCTYSPTTRMAI